MNDRIPILILYVSHCRDRRGIRLAKRLVHPLDDRGAAVELVDAIAVKRDVRSLRGRCGEDRTGIEGGCRDEPAAGPPSDGKGAP